jgi:hypothetical protein
MQKIVSCVHKVSLRCRALPAPLLQICIADDTVFDINHASPHQRSARNDRWVASGFATRRSADLFAVQIPGSHRPPLF